MNIEKWSISRHVRKQGCHSHRWSQPSNVNFWALRLSRRILRSYSQQHCRHSLCEPQGSSGCEKHRVLAPDSWAACERNEPRLLNLPIHRKGLNSLTWDIWFSLTSFKSFNKGFPSGSAGKESACRVGDLGLIPGLGRSPSEGKAHPLQYSGLQNSMDYTVAKSWTQLSDFRLRCLVFFN